jgi:hypothetical protein
MSTPPGAAPIDEKAFKGVAPVVPPAPSPQSVVEQLRVAAEKKRDRTWEQQALNRPMLFRRVPPDLREAVKEIAGDLQVRVDDVARAFLEFGLQCYYRGEIYIQPTLQEGRLTLFPKGSIQPGKNLLSGWVEQIQNQQPPARPTRKRRQANANPEKPWKWQVSYRGIPVEIQSQLRALHQEKAVPLGEIATLLLAYSLDAYQRGRLVLHPQPRTLPELTVTESKPQE